MLPPYHVLVLLFLYFVPYSLLVFRGQFLINPIQPALMFLCFEMYVVSRKIVAEPADCNTRDLSHRVSLEKNIGLGF
jgi:hypothetical protein